MLKLNICRFLLIVLFSVFNINLYAGANYIPLALSGFNADAVCSSTNCSGTNTLDGQWFYYSSSKKVEGSLPESIMSKMDIPYNLASFEDLNVLTISTNGTKTGTLTLNTPLKAKELWLLGMSASGQKGIDVTVLYTDDSTSATTKISFPDWFQPNGNLAALYGLGRASGSSNFDGRMQFGLFERVLQVDNTKTIKSIKFNYTGTDNTFTSVFAVTAYTGGRDTSEKELYMISNAHFDTQWDWDVQTSIDQYVKNTLEGNFNLFEKYPNYKFNFEGAIKYMFAKEYYPALYERLKGYVNSGRWHISGTSVDANDVMVPSAESIIRNFLLGHKFFKKEFNVDGGNDVMLPDCFGFPHTLPTLAAHCGIVGFHSQKLSWGSAYNYNDLPHYGLWRGVDGSEIFAVHKPGAYVNQYKENLAYNGDILNEIISNKVSLGANKTVRYFGTGDRGGSVDESTADWLEKSLASDGPVKVKTVTPDEFFNSISAEERAKLPVWDNELPMKAHGVGCYTSQAILKYWNRKGELLADATEKTSVVADWLGGLPYQRDVINDAWIRLLWHQFHDDLTGTSIPRAYVFTYNDHVMGLLNLSKTLDNASGAVSRQMRTQTIGVPIMVYNPLSIQREDIVEAKIAVAQDPGSISVYDTHGAVVPTQKIKFENGILHFLFKANMPSLGYVVYDLRFNDNAASQLPSNLIVTNNSIENEDYILTINKNGDVSSIKDKKQNNKELINSPIRLSLQSNQPGYWASWELSWDDVRRNPIAYVDENVEISIAESGALRSSLRIKRKKNGSEYVQLVRMTSGVNSDRIDFENEVDWQSKQTLLKVIFPLNANNAKATYDASIGVVERGNNYNDLYEVAGHQWADITHSDNSFGVSILNDSKYGWDKPSNNQLRLTLIHTPSTGNDRQYEKYQDLGLNKFTFSFYRHLGKLNEKTQWEASKLNQPLIAYKAVKHSGSLGKSFEFAKLNTDKVAIKAMKIAEEGDEIIVRMYELTGSNQENVELSFASNIVSVRELNGREQHVGAIDFSTNKINFNISKYQPRTFAVKLSPKTNAILTEPESRKAQLDYNVDVMSLDENKRDGRFGTTPYSFPGELFDDELVVDGIKFSIGSRAFRQKNAVQCDGQQINIPQSTSNKKLYILAASQNVNGSPDVSFLIDGVEKPLNIEYFAEQVGSWGTTFAERQYRKENIAFTATHRHNYNLQKNDSYSYLYIYKYVVDIDSNSKTLTLPNNKDVFVFAVTASDNVNDDVIPLTDTQSLLTFEYIKPQSESDPCGERLIPVSVTASGRTNINEHESMATDNNPNTKWNDDSGNAKYIQYSFDVPVQICQWNVLHAGLEGDDKITSDFTLQIKDGNTWVDVDKVVDNKDNKSVRTITSVTAQDVRMLIPKPQQNDGKTARVYSFDLFGTTLTDVKDIRNEMDFYAYTNSNNQIVLNMSLFNTTESNVHARVFNATGQLIAEQEVFGLETIFNQRFAPGVYLVSYGNMTQKLIVR
ncbi:glycoside hydrolase family 38 C-terminal domain-containing protein [Paludibacter sp.]